MDETRDLRPTKSSDDSIMPTVSPTIELDDTIMPIKSDVPTTETLGTVLPSSEPANEDSISRDYETLKAGILDVSEGEVVAGYRVQNLVGKGGMGKVFRVVDEMTGKIAALKILIVDSSLPESETKNQIERFTNEAQIMWRLSDARIPCVPAIYHMPRKPLGIIMEFLSGTPLDKLLAEPIGPEDKKRRIMQLVNMTSDIALALSKAHDMGIIHRDLKPANILIRERKDNSMPMEGVMVDFGIAKNPDRHLTESQTMMGTPTFMSPEQLMGKTDEVTPASDIFSMGLMLFRMISGEDFYKGLVPEGLPIFERIMGMLNVLSGKAVESDGTSKKIHRLSAVPEVFRPIIRHCIEFEVQNRFPSMNELASALKNIDFDKLDDDSTQIDATSEFVPPPPPPDKDSGGKTILDKPADKKKSKLWIYGLIAVAALIIAVPVAMHFSKKDEKSENKEVNSPQTEKSKPAEKKVVIKENKKNSNSCSKLIKASEIMSCIEKESTNTKDLEKLLSSLEYGVMQVCFSPENATGFEKQCKGIYQKAFEIINKSCTSKDPLADLKCMQKNAKSSIKSELLLYMALLEGYSRYCHGVIPAKNRVSSKACIPYENEFATLGFSGMKTVIKSLEKYCEKEKSPTALMECFKNEVKQKFKDPEVVLAGLVYLRGKYCRGSSHSNRAAASSCKWMSRHIDKARKKVDPYRTLSAKSHQ